MTLTFIIYLITNVSENKNIRADQIYKSKITKILFA